MEIFLVSWASNRNGMYKGAGSCEGAEYDTINMSARDIILLCVKCIYREGKCDIFKSRDVSHLGSEGCAWTNEYLSRVLEVHQVLYFKDTRGDRLINWCLATK